MNRTVGADVALSERAAPGLHEFCADLLSEALSRESRVLDIAAGTGAFCRQLQGLGFRNIAANDLDSAHFAAREIPFTSFDLNNDFATRVGKSLWDAIVAMEVVEHLENPAAFVRGLYSCLSPGGLVLISTPNVVNAQSRMIFLRGAYLNNFRDPGCPSSGGDPGHITILTDWLLKWHLSAAGFVDIRAYYPSTSAGTRNPGLRNVLGNVMESIVRLVFMPGQRDRAVGHWVVFLARKPA